MTQAADTIPDFALDASTRQRMVDRFLTYAKVHTQSDESSTTFPSTECQWDLLKLLKREVEEMGLEEVSLDGNGYLFASLPSNLPADADAPVVGLIAHVDTYPATSGKDVKPQIIEDYRGGDIVLPGDPEQVIREADNPNLKRCVGDTIITSDGTTLLGADDKAGIAIILTVVEHLKNHPEVRHGKVRIGFTPDEEVGKGADHFDVKAFGADLAYTVDGSVLGEIEDETFCADAAKVTLTGSDCHPGFGKGKLKNSIRAAAHLVERLPEAFLPETTEDRQPYLHPYTVAGDVARTVVNLLVRAFSEEELKEREASLERCVAETRERFPGVSVEVEITEYYRNMKVVLDRYPKVLQLALEGVRRAGLEPVRHSIRGGTDGARLSFMGLPTPNIFAGGQSFHSLREWVSVEWMAKSAETIFHLVDLWSRERK